MENLSLQLCKLKFCTESDPDTNHSSSNAVPVEAMGTSRWLCSCYHIMSLELLMKNWKVQTGRAAASVGSNKESIWASLSSQTVFKGLARDPDKQYRATKLRPLFGSTCVGEGQQGLKHMQQCQGFLLPVTHPDLSLLCAVRSEQSRWAGLHKYWVTLVVTLDDKTLSIFLLGKHR